MLWPAKPSNDQARDTRFDGMVESTYGQFPKHPFEYAKLAQPGWKPSMDSMWKWMRMCMAQKWAHSKETGVICMEPLNLRGGNAIKNLISYASDANRQLDAIFTNPATARHREHVNTIIIPVRWIGGWTLYCTSRLFNQQC